MASNVVVTAAVEGDVDEAVARRLARQVGAAIGDVYGKNGKSALRARVQAYNHAATYAPWLILADLDRDADCAPPFRAAWLPHPSRHLCFRVAVRQVEAWIMGDVETLAQFLRVSRATIPADPESIDNPKREIVNIARRSRLGGIRADLVPREGSGRTVGPAYTSRIIEYVETGWRPDVAASRSDSLRRAIACLQRLVELTP